MPEIAASRSTLRFADFDLDMRTGELRRQGVRVPLHDKPFQVLKALVESPGDLVTRRDLQRRRHASVGGFPQGHLGGRTRPAARP